MIARRDFAVTVSASALGLVLAGSGSAARAQGAPVEGQQFVRLGTAAPVGPLAAGKKIEVVEFFWYECPHCFAFEPLLDSWAKRLPADVQFRRVPVGFTARHVAAQKMFYALEATGQLEALHKRVFNAIHVQNQRLVAEGDMVAFVKAAGGDADKFAEAFRSFGVATAANRAKALTDAYKIDGVPALGVQGRFYTSGALAGSHERALAVADFLIQRARAA